MKKLKQQRLIKQGRKTNGQILLTICLSYCQSSYLLKQQHAKFDLEIESLLLLLLLLLLVIVNMICS